MICDKTGNLYGTTTGGGTSNNGVAYEISTSGTFSVIHTFCSVNCTDGASPNSLAMDAAGNLYGTTTYGGDLNCTDGNGTGCGTVFELSRSNGGWKENVLHRFRQRDGIVPIAGPTLATRKIGKKKQNVIFGLTYLSDVGNYAGTVFEMIESKIGYTFKVLYGFQGGDGVGPTHALTIARGNLYGTASLGGNAAAPF